MDGISAILLAGGGTALALVGEHYLLWHLRRRFAMHPPDAYTVGVLTLFGGYLLWTLLTGTDPAALVAYFAITAIGGAATRLAWRWHRHQDAAERQTILHTLDKGARDG